MTASQFSAAFTPNARDVLALRAALAWVIALIVTPIRRAALESRLERAALAARRSAMLSRSNPAGIAPLPIAVWEFAGHVDAVPPVPPYNHEPLAVITFDMSADWTPESVAVRYTAMPAVLEVLTVAEPIQSALIDPPAAPAPKRVRKPAAKKAAPKKTTVKAAANKPVKPSSKPSKTRKAPETPAEPVKAPRKRKAAAK